MPDDQRPSPLDAPARVVLRPIGLPIPLGYSALLLGGGLLGAFHLELLPVSEQHTVGLLLVAVVPPLQLVASVFALLGRDTPVGTEMGILAMSWLATGAVMLRMGVGETSPSLGVVQTVAALALVSPILATALTRVVPAAVLTIAAVHLLAAGVYQFLGTIPAQRAAGAISWLLALVALYGSVAFQLEDAEGKRVLALGRRSDDQTTIRGKRRRFDDVVRSPGVRKRF